MGVTAELSWYKSSYSGSEGDNCVEVAVCPSWFKSSHGGGEGDNCVEVAARARAVHVRDSKDTRIAPLTVSPVAWAGFVSYIEGLRG